MFVLTSSFFRRLGYVFLSVLLTAIFLILTVRLMYQYAWTATGNSSCISYDFNPSFSSFESVRAAVSAAAKKNQLEDSIPNLDSVFYGRWDAPKSWIGRQRPQLGLTLDAYPRDETDARKLNGHLFICTVEADKTDEWITLAKQLEVALNPIVHFTDARAQLDPRVFGACASKERPNLRDTICVIHLDMPVDFVRLNADLLLSRNNRKQEK